MSLLLSMLWLRRVAVGLTAGVDGLLLGETTMTVQALDLALVVPISVAVAVNAWRATDLGRAAGAAVAVAFTAMAGAITSMLLSAWAVEGSPEVAPLGIFGLATALGGWLYAISPFSQHRREAWDFIRFISSAPLQRHFALAAGIAPSRAAVLQDEQVLEANPHFRAQLAMFHGATSRPRTSTVRRGRSIRTSPRSTVSSRRPAR